MIELINAKSILQYSSRKEDPDELKCMLCMRKDFFLHNDLLYRKAYFKTTKKSVNQFRMSRQFQKWTVLVCHEDYGCLGMD